MVIGDLKTENRIIKLIIIIELNKIKNYSFFFKSLTKIILIIKFKIRISKINRVFYNNKNYYWNIKTNSIEIIINNL